MTCVAIVKHEASVDIEPYSLLSIKFTTSDIIFTVVIVRSQQNSLRRSLNLVDWLHSTLSSLTSLVTRKKERNIFSLSQ